MKVEHVAIICFLPMLKTTFFSQFLFWNFFLHPSKSLLICSSAQIDLAVHDPFHVLSVTEQARHMRAVQVESLELQFL